MNVSFGNTWLAPVVAGGSAAASDVRINGVQVVDDAAFFQAASMAFYPRGNLAVTFTFTVKRIFNTTQAAEVFVLMLPSLSPMTIDDLSVVQCFCGTAPNTQTVYMDASVLESVSVVEQRGLSVTIAFVIKGPGFQTDAPADTPPVIPTPEEGTLVYRRGLATIGAAATQVAVLFSSPFDTTPVVTIPGNLAALPGTANIGVRLISNSVSVSGFTAEFGAETPDATYTLPYWAVQ